MSANKAILTCAVTGVLTDPNRFPVPVTVEEMASSCKEAYDAGAAIMHIHFRDQRPGMGRMPTWDPDIAEAITLAVRDACPDVIINMSTGVMDRNIALLPVWSALDEIATWSALSVPQDQIQWPMGVATNGVLE